MDAIDAASNAGKADDVAKLNKLKDLLSDTTIDKAAFRMDPKDTLKILDIGENSNAAKNLKLSDKLTQLQDQAEQLKNAGKKCNKS